MRTETGSTGRPGGTFIEVARRSQIIEAAIVTVNETGYRGASLAQIAARAEISKSVISYHFDDKEELLLQVVDHVFSRFDAALREAVEATEGAQAKLVAYVRSYVLFVQENRAAVSSAVEISVSHRDADGVPLYLAESAADIDLVAGIVTSGIAAGAFRDVEVVVATTTIIHALDGAMTRSQAYPDTDLIAYGEHLAPLLLAALERRSDA